MSQKIDFTEGLPEAKFVGANNFVRQKPTNPPQLKIHKFHHLEFYTADATTTMRQFSIGFGMKLMAKSDQETGNHTYCSYVLQSRDLRFVITAPYSEFAPKPKEQKVPNPSFDMNHAYEFNRKHGLGVKAIGLLVDDARAAFELAVSRGGIPVLEPLVLGEGDEQVTIAEISAYMEGDAVVRFISFANPEKQDGFLPHYLDISAQTPDIDYGLVRIDHVVGNVAKAMPVYGYMNKVLEFYKFAEFIAEDVGTKDSGLNSVVVSNYNEMVLLPLNEPVFGTAKVSQIQNYLDHNEGPGVQHIAILCEDIHETVGRMKSVWGGFDFQKEPYPDYYDKIVPRKVGNKISKEEIERCREKAILIDTEGEGVLLQIFTQPLGDRPTIFVEIIQRLGCELPQGGQAAGCGGFGKGNFGALYQTIEDDYVNRGLGDLSSVEQR